MSDDRQELRQVVAVQVSRNILAVKTEDGRTVRDPKDDRVYHTRRQLPGVFSHG